MVFRPDYRWSYGDQNCGQLQQFNRRTLWNQRTVGSGRLCVWPQLAGSRSVRGTPSGKRPHHGDAHRSMLYVRHCAAYRCCYCIRNIYREARRCGKVYPRRAVDVIRLRRHSIVGGPRKWRGPKGRKAKLAGTRWVGFLERGCSHVHQLEDLGERCKLQQWCPGRRRRDVAILNVS